MTISDANSTGIKGKIFGLDETDRPDLVVLPVPWEATTSYGDGASQGPEAILKASSQVDLLDHDFGNFYERGISLYEGPEPPHIESINQKAKSLAQKVVAHLEDGGSLKDVKEHIQAVNSHSETVHNWVYERASSLKKSGHLVGLIGGDHSSPYGLIRKISEDLRGDFGILHIDAHADLRKAYQGFTHSHASIMFNTLQLPHRPNTLVQVGVRDYCQEELDVIHSDESISCFFDRDLKKRLFRGETWSQLCKEIVSKLPDDVYVSFDIDGLSPELCPSTGTPVPGGLSFDQAVELLVEVRNQNKKLVGFDLCEVAPSPEGSDWDGNVGARILYKLCGLYLTQGL